MYLAKQSIKINFSCINFNLLVYKLVEEKMYVNGLYYRKFLIKPPQISPTPKYFFQTPHPRIIPRGSFNFHRKTQFILTYQSYYSNHRSIAQNVTFLIISKFLPNFTSKFLSLSLLRLISVLGNSLEIACYFEKYL